MLQADKDKLKELLKTYTAKEVMRELSDVALEAAGDLSDNGNQKEAKEMTVFSVALEDLVTGRPFLV